jgi:hypothetical protein
LAPLHTPHREWTLLLERLETTIFSVWWSLWKGKEGNMTEAKRRESEDGAFLLEWKGQGITYKKTPRIHLVIIAYQPHPIFCPNSIPQKTTQTATGPRINNSTTVGPQCLRPREAVRPHIDQERRFVDLDPLLPAKVPFLYLVCYISTRFSLPVSLRSKCTMGTGHSTARSSGFQAAGEEEGSGLDEVE